MTHRRGCCCGGGGGGGQPDWSCISEPPNCVEVSLGGFTNSTCVIGCTFGAFNTQTVSVSGLNGSYVVPLTIYHGQGSVPPPRIIAVGHLLVTSLVVMIRNLDTGEVDLGWTSFRIGVALTCHNQGPNATNKWAVSEMAIAGQTGGHIDGKGSGACGERVFFVADLDRDADEFNMIAFGQAMQSPSTAQCGTGFDTFITPGDVIVQPLFLCPGQDPDPNCFYAKKCSGGGEITVHKEGASSVGRSHFYRESVLWKQLQNSDQPAVLSGVLWTDDTCPPPPPKRQVSGGGGLKNQ